MTPSSLLLVGCGKMGGALLERWQQSTLIERFDVIEPQYAAPGSRVTWHRNLESLPPDYVPDVVVFAVKPQHLDAVLPAYKIRFGNANPLYISIAAGKKLSFYASHLGERAHIVRAMPNTPAMVGEGMTVLCSAPTLPASAKKIALDLMSAVGKAEWLPNESLMDAVTAISGCGPAYVFLFLESMVKAGVAVGLPEDMAKILSCQTVLGSLKLAAQSGKTLEQLRIQVASPGGATEAALNILMQSNNLQSLLEKAVDSATARSKQLSEKN